MTAESTLSTFVASDGDNVVIQDWPLEPGVPLRGAVVLVEKRRVVEGVGEAGGLHKQAAAGQGRRVAHVLVPLPLVGDKFQAGGPGPGRGGPAGQR